MALSAGYTGQVKISTNVISSVKSSQFDLQRTMEDVTVMLGTPSAFKAFFPTLIDATFSITAEWDPGDTNGQVAMENALLNGTLLSFTLTPNNGTNTYTFSAYVKKISNKTDVSKVVEANYDLQPSGTISFT